MNWLKKIFNWKKAPRAINEIKPVDMNKYIHPELRMFIFIKYWKVKKSWKRSPKNYSIFYNDDNILSITNNNSICKNSFQSKNNVVVGNLYTLYHQYYGKENNN